MTAAAARAQASTWPFGQPLAWRVVAWGLLAVVTGLSAGSLWAQLASGACMAAAGVVMQFIDGYSVSVRTTAIVAATVLGLVAVFIAPSGLGEVPAYVAISKLPLDLATTSGRAFLVVDTIAMGVAVGLATQTLAGALAGLGVPLVAPRASERNELVAARTRAEALLSEVRAGREAEAQAATLQERSRIARDLHDVLAHSLAGLSVQLQGLRAVAAREGVGPDVLEPLDRAAQLAKDGLGEARAAVSALRDPVALGLDELPTLVTRYPGHANFDETGTRGTVAPEAGHAVYRAVQEALTNSARHAPGSTVRVCLAWAPDVLRARVDDTGGTGAVPDPALRGSGLGLAGMQERIHAVGGATTAGPGPDGGWRVEVTVPVS